MPRTRVGSVAHAGCAGHPLTPARSRGGAATYIWTQFAAKPSRAVSSITNKKRQYKIGSNKVTWDKLGSFLGINIKYDIEGGTLTMDVKSKVDELFKNHSPLLNCSRRSTPLTKENYDSVGFKRAKVTPLDQYILDNYSKKLLAL